jgi:hypothetical protein
MGILTLIHMCELDYFEPFMILCCGRLSGSISQKDVTKQEALLENQQSMRGRQDAGHEQGRSYGVGVFSQQARVSSGGGA